MEKQELRKQMMALRSQMTEEEIQLKSSKIVEHLLQMDSIRQAQHILAYLSFREEATLQDLLDHQNDRGKRIAVPRILQGTHQMQAVPYLGKEKLVKSKWGILEPSPEIAPLSPKQLDAALIPGIAFDRMGRRLGYGGGFYDRFLPLLAEDAVKIGVCFEMQLVDQVPADPHDIPMDAIVTENGAYDLSDKPQ